MGKRQGLRRRLVLLLMAVALVGGLLTPSPPPAQAAALVLAPTCTTAGGSVEAGGSGAPPGVYVTFHMPQAMGWTSLQVPVGSTRADTKGNFSGGFGIPSGLAPGGYAVEARWAQGMASGLLGTATVTVVAERSSCPAPPPERAYPAPFTSISMVSASDGWAAGGLGTKQLWRYDGAAWSVYPQDFPESTNIQVVYMLSANEGWAGGSAFDGGQKNVFYRYDGQSWSLYQALAMGDGQYSGVRRLRMTSAIEGWALAGDTHNRYELAYRFDGKEWSVQNPLQGVDTLIDVSMTSAQEGWAVGGMGHAYQYKDGQWSPYTFQDPALQAWGPSAVFMLSATDGWMAGISSVSDAWTILARWDGQDWRLGQKLQSLDPYECSLAPLGSQPARIASIFMLSPTAGLAVGGQCILRYDGTAWQIHPLQPPYNDFQGDFIYQGFLDTSLVSPTQGWIVGLENWRTIPGGFFREFGGFYRYTGASLTLNPTSGPPGTPVTVKGSGFSTDSQVGLSWGGSLALSKVWPKTDGSFTTSVVVPGQVLSGTYKLVAQNELAGADGETRSGEAAFRVTSLPPNTTVYSIEAPASVYARLAGSYGSAPPGELDGQYSLKVRVSRVQPLPWQPASGIGVTFNILESPQGVSLSANSATTDSQGYASVTVNLGQTEGNTTVALASGTASATVLIHAFRQPAPPSGLPPGFIPGAITGGLSAPPAIKLKPSIGPPGTQLEIQGSGFQSSFVDVYFDGQTKLGGTYAFAGSLGGTLKVEIPLGAAVGEHTVTAFNQAGDYASATYTVGSPATLEPTPTPTPTPSPGATPSPTPTPTPTPVLKGTVQGTIYEWYSNKPVGPKYGTSANRVKIHYRAYSGSTLGPELSSLADDEGHYVLHLSPGTYNIKISNVWYGESNWQTLQVQAGSTETQDWRMRRNEGVVQGTVGLTDFAGGAITRGVVGLILKFGDLYTSQTYEAVTGQDGSYAVCVPVGTYKMQIEMDQKAAAYGLLGQILKMQHEVRVYPIQNIGKSLDLKAGTRSPAQAASCSVGGGETVQHDVTFLGALAAPAQSGQKYQVQGTVNDSLTGQALANIELRALKLQEESLQRCRENLIDLMGAVTTRTDTTGKYTLVLDQPGTYAVSPSLPAPLSGASPQCVKVQSSNVTGVDFTTAAPSFLPSGCPVSGQERRLQQSWLTDYTLYLQAVLPYTGAYGSDAAAAANEAKAREMLMNQIKVQNEALKDLAIDLAWAAQQQSGVLNRLLVDVGPYVSFLGSSGSTTLSASDQKAVQGIISGYYKQFPKGASKCSSPRLQVQGHSPFTLLLVDEEGRQTGVDPSTQVLTNTIPGASYTGPLTQTQILEVPYPSGRYWVQATGTGAGQWGIDVVGFEGQKATATTALTGTIQTAATFLAAASVAASGLEPAIQVSVPLTMTRKVHLPFLANSAQGW